MSTETEKLGLFKYDPSTDGASTFNIRQALNENWDKIDQNAKEFSSALSGIDQTIAGLSPDQIGAASNLNLLDNWYFADPINQRGATDGSYVNDYTIDRWKLLNIGYVTFNDGYITIKSKDGYPPYFSQFFDDAFLKSIVGKQITLSALMRGAADECGIEMFGRFYAYSTSADNWNVVTKTVTVPSDITTIRVGVRNLDMVGDVPLDVQAMKLELGDHQTLAHQDENGNWILNDPPPDKNMELLKCCMSTADSNDEYANNNKTTDALHAVNKAGDTMTGPLSINGYTKYSYAGKKDDWVASCIDSYSNDYFSRLAVFAYNDGRFDALLQLFRNNGEFVKDAKIYSTDNVTASNTDISAGSTGLTNGFMYLVYE